MNADLLLLADGRFPAGGHTNSAGVESAVRIGDVADLASLEQYLRGRLAVTGMVDAAFAARTVVASADELAPLDREYDARTPSPALRSASRTFGRQLLRAGATVWTSPLVDAVAASPSPHQPIVLGALVGAAGGGPDEAAAIAMHHLSAAVATAAVRLLGLDPMEVARVQASAATDVELDAAAWAAASPGDLPANAGTLTDILAECHARSDRLFAA